MIFDMNLELSLYDNDEQNQLLDYEVGGGHRTTAQDGLLEDRRGRVVLSTQPRTADPFREDTAARNLRRRTATTTARQESSLAVVIRMQERDVLEMFVKHILENKSSSCSTLTRVSLLRVWKVLPDLLHWMPQATERLLDAFLIPAPFSGGGGASCSPALDTTSSAVDPLHHGGGTSSPGGVDSSGEMKADLENTEDGMLTQGSGSNGYLLDRNEFWGFLTGELGRRESAVLNNSCSSADLHVAGEQAAAHHRARSPTAYAGGPYERRAASCSTSSSSYVTKTQNQPLKLGPVSPFVVAVPELIPAETGLLDVLVENDVPSSFFLKPIVRVLIDYKWKIYAHDELIFHLRAYFIYLVAYTVFCLQLRMHSEQPSLVDRWFSEDECLEVGLWVSFAGVCFVGVMNYRAKPEFGAGGEGTGPRIGAPSVVSRTTSHLNRLPSGRGKVDPTTGATVGRVVYHGKEEVEDQGRPHLGTRKNNTNERPPGRAGCRRKKQDSIPTSSFQQDQEQHLHTEYGLRAEAEQAPPPRKRFNLSVSRKIDLIWRNYTKRRPVYTLKFLRSVASTARLSRTLNRRTNYGLLRVRRSLTGHHLRSRLLPEALQKYANRYFLVALAVFILIVQCITAPAVNAIACLVMFLYTMRAVLNEIIEAKSKTMENYLFSVWNVFDLTLCFLSIGLLILYVVDNLSSIADPQFIKADSDDRSTNTYSQSTSTTATTNYAGNSNLHSGVDANGPSPPDPDGPSSQRTRTTTWASLAILLVWHKCLYFFLPFRKVGSFIRMIIEIFSDIRYFLLVCFVTLGGFGSAFFVLYKEDWTSRDTNTFFKNRNAELLAENDSNSRRNVIYKKGSYMLDKDYVRLTQDDMENEVPHFPSVFQTLLSMYVLMLGDWELQKFTHAEHYVLAPFLFVVFTFMMMVVLFNMLIALMSETYERVRENEEAEFLKTRAECIVDMEKLRWRTVLYPDWVHALLPAGGNNGTATSNNSNAGATWSS
ncbi:unnamed protein product [Amoebophrya sp. A120]|nr:unnamed protein product [Amoebophrya sp. A120]|eukprot:GSA120T00009617001.1